ncbi:MAG: hypothetical protein K2N54_00090 [Helicobacter sp.]|nr:hypothetical protein [Helicobacter sp.]
MCVALAYANIPQRGGNVMPCGSNIAAARCGWDAHIMSNSREMFRYAQHDKWRCGFNRTYNFMSATKVAPPKILYYHKIIFSCHCERATRARQSTDKES